MKLVLILLTLAGVQVCGQEQTPVVFDFRAVPAYRDYRKVIRQYAREYRPRQTNSFCAVGLRNSPDGARVMIIWKEGAEIISWTGEEQLDFCPRTIHLKTDVVETEDEINGSTYLTTRAWVQQRVKTCRERGVEKVITARR